MWWGATAPYGLSAEEYARAGTVPIDGKTLAQLITTRNMALQTWPDASQLASLKTLTKKVIKPLERLVGPIRITSGYRSGAVNTAAGGVPTSDHMTGRAIDFKLVSGSSESAIRAIWDSGLSVDQAILYHPSKGGHVHVGYRSPAANRNKFLYRDDSGYRAWSPGGLGGGALAAQAARAVKSGNPFAAAWAAMAGAERMPWWGWAILGTAGLGLTVVLVKRVRTRRMLRRYS